MQVHDAPLAGARAQSILKPILLRRTKDSKLEGKPLLTLPPKDIELVMLQFSPEERQVRSSLLDIWNSEPIYFADIRRLRETSESSSEQIHSRRDDDSKVMSTSRFFIPLAYF